MPTPPLTLGLCFVANRILFELMEKRWLNQRDEVTWASHEVRECLIAWLFLVLAAHFTVVYRGGGGGGSAAPRA